MPTDDQQGSATCACAASTDEGCFVTGGSDGVLQVFALGGAGATSSPALLQRVSCVGGAPSAVMWLPSLRGILTIEPLGALDGNQAAAAEHNHAALETADGGSPTTEKVLLLNIF